MRKGGGYTLLEVLTVVAIITTLVGLCLPVYAMFKRHREITRAENDLSNAVMAIRMLKDEYDYDDVLGLDAKGNIIDTLDEAIFKELDPNNPAWKDTYTPYLNSRKRQYFPLREQHVKEVKGETKVVDPWGTPYQYRVIEKDVGGITYYIEKIWSYGPDKEDGTADDMVRILTQRAKLKK